MTQAGTTAPRGPYADMRQLAARVVDSARVDPLAEVQRLLPAFLVVVTFALLFAQPIARLVHDWWTLPEAGHGLLLAPVSLWLAWKAGIRRNAQGNAMLGVAMLLLAVVIRFMAGLAAELFTMRASIVLALGGLTVFYYGFRQLLHWWLPFLLVCLAIPLPELLTQALALPLQFKASQLGAALLRTRDIPVLLTGNVIRIPGHELFVTEACSGLRSLTALLSLAVLMGGLMLRLPLVRVLLVALAIPIAIAINGIRVFLTGFLVYFVDPALGTGFMHATEGWLLFVISFSCIAAIAWVAAIVERKWSSRGQAPELVDAEELEVANA